jgi:hypothetical protein
VLLHCSYAVAFRERAEMQTEKQTSSTEKLSLVLSSMRINSVTMLVMMYPFCEILHYTAINEVCMYT